MVCRAAQATALGESADAAAFVPLAEFTRFESPFVRRLAASVLGELAGILGCAGQSHADSLPLADSTAARLGER